MINKIKKNSLVIKLYQVIRRNLTRISPFIATKVMYRVAFKKNINLNNPVTFNEKLQWIKLYWKSDLKAICADKYEVTNYAKQMECGEIVNEVYNVYNDVDEIKWDELPNKFALKCTHGCGANIICNDKSKLDINKSIKQLKTWMKEDYSLEYAEIHYKDIKPRIICEKYLETEAGILPIDYKVFCFNGQPKVTMVCCDRKVGGAKYYFYNNDWEIMPYDKSGINHLSDKENNSVNNHRPKSFSKMLEYAEKLSKPFPFVRVDFYEVDGKPILGEMTFTPAGCLDSDLSEQAELEMGGWIKL